MALDEMLKGFAALNQGLSELAIGTAARDAQAQIADMHATIKDEKEKLARANAIGQELGLRIQSAGGTQADVMANAGRLSVSAGETAQLQNAIQQKQMGQEFRINQELPYQRETELQKIREHNKGLLGKQNRALTSQEMTFVGKHTSQFEAGAKKPLEALNQIRATRDLLNSDNPLADNTIPTFMARASGEVGNLSEADKRPFGGNQSFAAKWKQASVNAATGKLTAENRKLIGQVLDILEKRHIKNTIAVRDRIAKRGAKAATLYGYDIDENRMKSLIYEDPNAEMAQPASQPVGGAQPPAAIAAPPGNKYLMGE